MGAYEPCVVGTVVPGNDQSWHHGILRMRANETAQSNDEAYQPNSLENNYQHRCVRRHLFFCSAWCAFLFYWRDNSSRHNSSTVTSSTSSNSSFVVTVVESSMSPIGGKIISAQEIAIRQRNWISYE